MLMGIIIFVVAFVMGVSVSFVYDVLHSKAQEKYMYCQFCGSKIHREDQFCSNCGKQLKRIIPMGRNCEKCGEPLVYGSEFCHKCGSSISEVSKKISPKHPIVHVDIDGNGSFSDASQESTPETNK